MLRPERSIERVYLHRAPIDMRNYAESFVMPSRCSKFSCLELLHARTAECSSA